MDGELPGEVLQRVEVVGGIEAFLVLAVAALYFSIVSWRVGTDELVSDTQLGGSGLKQSREIPLAVGEAIGKLKTIVCLDTLHPDPSADIPLEQLFEKIRGGIGGLLRVGS